MNLKIYIILLIQITYCQDLGCTLEFPKRCPNKLNSIEPICKKDYQECEGFQGCTNTLKPYICPNGVCASSFFDCIEKYSVCPSSKFQKCVDGLCRTECNRIRHSSCSGENSIRCPDGRCVNLKVKCASAGCPGDEPYTCPDYSCKKSFTLCNYPQNIKIIKKTYVYTPSEYQENFLFDQNNNNIMSYETNEQQDIEIEGVALSEIENTQLEYDKNYDQIYKIFYMRKGKDLKPTDFLRSVIFKLTAFDKETKKSTPIIFNINIDYIFSNSNYDDFKRSELYCLGRLENHKWICDKKHEKNINAKYLSYKINQNGIYSVLFYPQMPLEQFQREVFCGLMCKYNKLSYYIIFIIIPLFLLFLHIVYRIYQKKIQSENLRFKNKFINKKIKEVENINVDFIGQTIFEKIEEGVTYFVNPIRNKKDEDLQRMQDLNKQYDELKKTKRNQQLQKNQFIRNNKTNIEKIRQLRNDLQKYENELEQSFESDDAFF